MKSFASDNYAGVASEMMQALLEANRDHQPSYGHDELTKKAVDLIQKQFNRDCKILFVFNGTAANTLSLKIMARSHHSIISQIQRILDRTK